MAKAPGRPKKHHTRKQRQKCVILTPEAERILDRIRQHRPDFDLSRYLSEHIERDFSDPVQMRKNRIAELQKQADWAHREMQKEAEEIKREQDKRMQEHLTHEV